MKKLLSFLRESVISKSSPFVYLTGLCLILAASDTLTKGSAIGVTVVAVLVLSSAATSLFARFIPKNVRTIAHMLVISVFVAIIEFLFRKFTPNLFENLGIYLPLVAVNGIAFASVRKSESEKPVTAIVDSLSSGISFSAVILVMSLVREILGIGTFFGIRLIPKEYAIGAIASPFGAFVLLGLMFAAVRCITSKLSKEEIK